MNAMDVRRDISIAVDAVVSNLQSRVFANGESEIGELIARAIKRVGKEGIGQTIALSRNEKILINELEIVEWMKLDRGYTSHTLPPIKKNQRRELDEPLTLIHEKKISIVKVLELALKRRRPLLIIYKDVESEALVTLIINKLRATIKVCAIKAHGFGEHKKEILHDLAALTGGEFITNELGINPGKGGPWYLLVTISKYNTAILDGSWRLESH
ncbi:unnamed protein product, partial [Thlaspi arvense]